MTNRPDLTPPPPSVTPGKMAVIAVLAIVLVVVLVVQFSGEDTGPVVMKRRKSSSAPSGDTSGQVPSLEAEAHQPRQQWPVIDRDEVISFNPFEIPTALQAPAVQSLPADQVAQSSLSVPEQVTGPDLSNSATSKPDDQEAMLRAAHRKSRLERIRATASDLRKQGVALVLATSTGAVAKIGDEEVRVGDVLNGVLRIAEIGPQGMVVEELPDSLIESESSAKN